MLEVVCPPEGIQEEPQLPLSGLTYGFLIINCSGVILTIICLIIIQVRVVILLRYESSTLILYKELSSPIFQSCQASVTPVQISTLCNI